MKMAKPSKKDIDAAGDLMALLLQADRGGYPGDRQNAPDFFDDEDPAHLRAFYDAIKATLDKAPGYPGRVIGGMCYVIMFDKNEIIDPDSDVIELHPKLAKALEGAAMERERQMGAGDLPYNADDLLELIGVANDLREIKHWKTQAGSKHLAQFVQKLNDALTDRATASGAARLPDVSEMVNRFLGWPLPKTFGPDCGISFDGRKDDEWNKNKTWPVGTNLLTADEAKAMFEHCIGKVAE